LSQVPQSLSESPDEEGSNCGAFCHKFGAYRYFPDRFLSIRFVYPDHG
jgi:hypothetical protein